MSHDLRAMVDAIGYVTRYGIEWRALPVDFPPWTAVYAFFERWSERELPHRLADRLRGRIRIAVGRASGWLTRHRRLVRDYERRPDHHEAMVWWASVAIMTRRLTRELAAQPPQPRWGQPRQTQPTAA